MQAPAAVLVELDHLIQARERERPSGSYTTALFEAGIARIAQKVGEEGVETALAAVTADDAALTAEAADLMYHLLVLLRARRLGFADVAAVLASRAR
jgi:phosphoribosyl-ATP pyrophosphohydrolase/phosphoribosyl-AMP cyclohydrolase